MNNKKDQTNNKTVATIDDIDFTVPAMKLAVLLDNSTMPNDVKDAWIALLPEMTLEQIDEFLNILEAKYLDEQTKDIDKKYQEKLQDLMARYKKEDENNKKKLLKNLNDIEKHF